MFESLLLALNEKPKTYVLDRNSLKTIAELKGKVQALADRDLGLSGTPEKLHALKRELYRELLALLKAEKKAAHKQSRQLEDFIVELIRLTRAHQDDYLGGVAYFMQLVSAAPSLHMFANVASHGQLREQVEEISAAWPEIENKMQHLEIKWEALREQAIQADFERCFVPEKEKEKSVKDSKKKAPKGNNNLFDHPAKGKEDDDADPDDTFGFALV